MFDSINRWLTDTETKFNIAGGIPYLCIASGAVRAVAGVVQAVVGSIFSFIGACGECFSENPKWKEMRQQGAEYIIHGALNTLRGLGETVLGLVSFGFINLLLLAEQGHADHIGPYYPYQKAPVVA